MATGSTQLHRNSPDQHVADILKRIQCCCDGNVIESTDHICKDQGYLNALAVWINKPHVIDRRLCGAKILQCKECTATSYTDQLQHIIADGVSLKKLSDTSDSHELNEVYFDASNEGEESMYIVLRDLYPKQHEKYPIIREVILLDCKCALKRCIFIPLYRFNKGDKHGCFCTEDTLYLFSYSETQRLNLHAAQSSSESTDKYNISIEWLKTRLFPKIKQWSCEENLKTSLTSLRLIPVDKYTELYSHMKEKYGYELVKLQEGVQSVQSCLTELPEEALSDKIKLIEFLVASCEKLVWPECTDPQKFVYEDIAIATYLLLLWEQERKDRGLTKKQSFIDLGCGNGLLVYLLSKEGHPGKGIDLRKRNIWSLFSDAADLEEMSLTPSSANLFPDHDWLIGNHSDELTPWIPIIASRSSYSCRYFVLPCCFHDFDSKFCAKKKGSSQYRTYLDYIKNVGEVSGFHVEEDTLRIPSTKRICFIGKSRTYTNDKETEVEEERSQFIMDRCKYRTNNCDNMKLSSSEVLQKNFLPDELQCELNHSEQKSCSKNNLTSKDSDGGNEAPTSESFWAECFTPRSNTERTRNCVTVDQTVKEKIVHDVFIKILIAEDSVCVSAADGSDWRKGGSIPLSDVAGMFDRDILRQLKCECGGIQTLLRNHNHIFQVSGGCVQLRDLSCDNPWSVKQNEKRQNKTEYLKTCRCWFFDNHPDGCPRTSEHCPFAHGELELRERPPNRKKAKTH